MLEFDLPCLPGNTPVPDALTRLIHARLSGVVIANERLPRLLHYNDLVTAWQSGVTTLSEVPGGRRLPHHAPPPTRSGPSLPMGPPPPPAPADLPPLDYELVNASPSSARVRSRRESLAGIYLAHPAGYCCDGPDQHCYPPYTRGSDDDCVVFPCPGKLP